MTAPIAQQAMDIAMRHHRAGELAQAEAIYRHVLAEDPENPDALHLLGVLAHQVARHEDAIQLITRALQLRPSAAEYHSNLGEVFSALGRMDQALACYRAAIRSDPKLMQSYSNLSVVLLSQNKLAQAADVLATAIEIGPHNAGIFTNLGIVLTRQGKLQAAVEAFERVVALDPASAEARCNLGLALLSMNRLSDSIAMLREAIALQPNYPLALNNLALALQTVGDVTEAIKLFLAALDAQPNYIQAHSNLLLAMHYATDYSAQEIFDEHLRWVERHAAQVTPTRDHANGRNPDRRLKIGYVSGDFRQHSVAFFIEPLLEKRERRNFELFCYSDVQSPDAVTARFERLADQWRPITGMSDARVADLLRQDQIDILVDLAAHTGSRLLVFAQKPAPVQVTYLGYPDTTGLRTIDYRITDPWADPVATGDSFYTEQLIRTSRTAWCYRPAKLAPSVGPLPARKNGFITFGSFNVVAKVSDQAISLWARALMETPNSRLLLKASGLDDAAARSRIIERFAARGVEAHRLILIGRTPSLEAHLKTYHQIDIALDSFPYHGTTTTCDALWMGVPVVTLAGDRHVSRVGVSLLSSVGLDRMIASTEQQFGEIIASLVRDPDQLSALRSGMRQRLERSPLLDANSLAREIETFFRDAWRRWCAGSGGSR